MCLLQSLADRRAAPSGSLETRPADVRRQRRRLPVHVIGPKDSAQGRKLPIDTTSHGCGEVYPSLLFSALGARFAVRADGERTRHREVAAVARNRLGVVVIVIVMVLASVSIGTASASPGGVASSGVQVASVAAGAWPMFGCDAQHTGRSPYVGAANGTLKWYRAAGSYGMQPAAIGPDGTLYARSGDYNLYALNPTTGATIWSRRLNNESVGTPAIGADGTIYVGDRGTLYALNPADGSVKWTLAVSSYVSPITLGADGTLYFSCGFSLYSVNPVSRTVNWTRSVSAGDTSSYSCPAISPSGNIYVGNAEGWIYGFKPDGAQLWLINIGMSYYSSGGSPAVGTTGLVYVGSGGGKVYALREVDGTTAWTYTTGSSISAMPAIGSDGTVFIGSDDSKLYALNPAAGTLRWSKSLGGPIYSPAAIGSDGALYLSSNDGNLYSLNPSDGSVRWKSTLGCTSTSAPLIGPDGTIYASSSPFSLGTNPGVYARGGATKPTYSTKLALSGNSSVYRSHTYKLAGAISPASAGVRVKVLWKRYYSGAYRTVKTAYATISGGRFACSYKPATRGKWRAYVSYSGQTTTSAVYKKATTVYKALTVK